jgi:peptidoglycan/LPS O-acetylase OafA/YrhL
MDPSTRRTPRWPGLDILRAAAVFLVLLYHFPNVFPPRSLSQTIFRKIEWFGWTGVDLFLVLSGFLIGNLLFAEFRKHARIDLKRFWLRRAFKIYPPFYLLLLLWLLHVFPLDTPLTARAVLGEALFLQNYVGHLWTHTWSLALEEHFYLLIGLASCGLFGRLLIPRWPAVVFFVAASCLSLRVWMSMHSPFDPETHLFPTHLRLDSLFIGSGIAYAFNFRQTTGNYFTRRFRWLLLGFAFLCLAAGLTRKLGDGAFPQTLGLTLLAIGYSTLVALVVFGAFSLTLPTGAAALLLIGRCSYGIYLWHMTVLRKITPLIEQYIPFGFGYVELLLYLTLSVGIGIALTRCVEIPFLRFRDRHFPSRASTPIPRK